MRKLKLIPNQIYTNITIQESEIIPIKLHNEAIITKSDRKVIGSNKASDSFSNKAIWLDYDYDWEIIKDENDSICLICKPKQNKNE